MLKKLITHFASLWRQNELEGKPQQKSKSTSKKNQSRKRILTPETDGYQGLSCHISYQIDGQDDLVTVFVSREPTPEEALSFAKRHNREVFGNLRTGEIVITDVFCVSDNDLKVE